MSLTHHRRVVALVQARMGSRRLPGKMMMDLRGHPILHWVLTRLKRARRIERIVLATTNSPRDDLLVELSLGLGIDAYRGSENDVLGRFSEAARMAAADAVVRVCADNPLIAPEEVDRLVAAYGVWVREGADPMKLYAFNHMPSEAGGYPDGLGAQVASAPLLHHVAAVACASSHREHVFDYIEENAAEFDIRAVPAPPEIRDRAVKLDVDTAEDLAFLRTLCEGLSPDSDAAMIVRAARSRRIEVP